MVGHVSWLAIATILASSAPAVAQPPIFIPQPPPMSPPPSPPNPSDDVRTPAVVRIIGVRITAGGHELANDRLRVRTGQAGSFNISRTEASVSTCAKRYMQGDVTGSIGFSIYSHSQQVGGGYRVMFNWSRPVDTGNCAAAGSQKVGIEQNVMIDPAQPTIIHADADTMIELRLLER